jgi:hypothetical protein
MASTHMLDRPESRRRVSTRMGLLCAADSPSAHLLVGTESAFGACLPWGSLTVRGQPSLGMACSPAVARATGPRRGHVSSTCSSRALGNRKAILTCMSASPQIPHKSGSAVRFPTESPRTKRHSPAQDGTGANMALLALTSLYAGSAGLAILKLPVVRASTDLLKSGRSGGSTPPLTTYHIEDDQSARSPAQTAGGEGFPWR